ncbi:glycosyltransferase [Piscinibacter sakaiensis]|uniref:glycosyltransferase n=1 Tax=Piscinibacter sakaiensis TaxID=1547922 RepID=UPI003AAAB0D5
MSAVLEELAPPRDAVADAMAPQPEASFEHRPRVSGKFLYAGDAKLWVRGVTYGSFGEQPDGDGYPPAAQLDADFAAMRANGINALRCYTLPPRRLLDRSQQHGLRVMVGLAWEQHIAFLDEPGRADAIVQRVGEDARRCAGHPALLCYAVGNEIPASIVRWHGRRRIERFIERLYSAVKAEDPAALVTYVNFPTTEYLQLPFLDLFCFNVYLEDRERLEAYLARLQNQAGEKPLLMAEIGLDSRRNGLEKQAESLEWQVRSAFASGCAGTFVFAWTDEWHRGGFPIDDWDFGLVARDRTPKPALAAVRRAYSELPFPANTRWPRITVVVCSYNGSRTIRDTLDGLQRLAYPDFEVIVVDDGSTDSTAAIAGEYDVRLISTDNRGLSAARNTGWQQASGEIVAYIDDDAWPDPHWLHYLAWRIITGDWVGVGGPNIAPPGDGPIADCVANAPGGPVHVLVSDIEAEHIPGCNMAFRRDALAAIDGFDVRYRTAGDDVDICWRLQQAGGRIGFHAGAMDWHHRRNSLVMYWRQQKGYGKAEALLEQKWPERYNAAGHLAWRGQLYGRGFTLPIPSGRSRVYGGVWGSAAYQSLYQPAPLTLLQLPLMPEWYLVIGGLAALLLLGLSWPPLLWAWPLLALAAAGPLVQAAIAATQARFPIPARSTGERMRRWGLTFLMHLMQPMARLIGRLEHGLTPWRRRGRLAKARLRASHATVVWSETWRPAEQWIEVLEAALRQQGGVVRRGDSCDEWDLLLLGGGFCGLELRLAVEEHGGGRQLVRIATRFHFNPIAAAAGVVLLAAGTAAALQGGWVAAGALAAAGFAIAIAIQRDCAASSGCWAAVAQGAWAPQPESG